MYMSFLCAIIIPSKLNFVPVFPFLREELQAETEAKDVVPARRRVTFHHLFQEGHRQVYRVTATDMLCLDSRQHGVYPASLRRALVLHRRIGQHHLRLQRHRPSDAGRCHE